MAKPIQIPKTTSSPADPSTPSFLTTVPPEVRNAVYEVLFKRDEHVLLHNAKAYHPTPPKRSDYMGDEDHMEDLERYNEIFEKNMKNDREFKHGFGCGLSVLLSCRQVYQECAGVLYGSNAFLISRALHRHDNNNNIFLDYEMVYGQLKYAPLWLNSLGSQVGLLHKVYIDPDAICPNDCGVVETLTFDMLPMMRVIWKHPELAKKKSYSPELEGKSTSIPG